MNPHRPYLVGIAGPSCAGKTELSRQLSALFSAPILPLDCYYFDLSHLPPAERARQNFDVPAMLDHDLFCRHLTELSRGAPIQRPVYDFATHSRTTGVEVVQPAPVIIVEGLFVLYWEVVRSLLDIKIFVDLDDESCLGRRLIRDVKERGRTPESVVSQFHQTVSPMAAQYIRPTRDFADLVILGDSPIEKSVATVTEHMDLHRASGAE